MNKSGSIFGGTLLIAGTCIGAAMLGLPVITGIAGFVPSTVMFVVGWLFMMSTGLLLLEVNIWLGESTGIVSMAQKTLGRPGKIAAWALFLFLFYSLMVAYISASGALVVRGLADITGKTLPQWVGSLLFIGFFGSFVYRGTRSVDLFNRFLMLGLVVAYGILVWIGTPHVNKEYLSHHNFNYAFFSLPVVIIGFGFHNIVPTLAEYFKGDRKRLFRTVLLGSTITLLIYLLWEWIIVGTVPLEGAGGLIEALAQGKSTTEALRATAGKSLVVSAAQYFALFALVTSFLGVALSFVDFLSDGLHVSKTRWGSLLLIALVLVPPFIFGLVYQDIFLKALQYAGGFGAVVLFGVMPALMVWNSRYRCKVASKPLVPGGRPVLLLIIVFAFTVVGLELAQELGWSPLPSEAEILPGTEEILD